MTGIGKRSAGDVLMLEPARSVVEIITISELLDLAVAERLDMEGGRTGRLIHFRPSAIRQYAS